MYKKVKVRLPANLLLDDNSEAKGIVVAMSAEEMVIASHEKAQIGDVIIAYVNRNERLQGTVTKIAANGFSIKMVLPDVKKQKIIEFLMAELARQEGIAVSDELVMQSRRGALRRKVHGREAICIRQNGDELPCSIADISLTGLGIRTGEELFLNEVVRIGNMTARVVRSTSNGYGLQLVSALTDEKHEKQRKRHIPRNHRRLPRRDIAAA